MQFDGQITSGQLGGPVVDAGGRVIGVAVATLPGRATNLAIPVGRLSEFLTAPGISFDPPALAYADRSEPVRWAIKLEPATPGAKLPEGLSVQVTIAHRKEDRRTIAAKPLSEREGAFWVEVTPVPSDPPEPRPVRAIAAKIEAKRGSDVLATVYRRIDLVGAPSPVPAAPAAEPGTFIIWARPRPPIFGVGGRDLPLAPYRITIFQEGPSDDGMLTGAGCSMSLERFKVPASRSGRRKRRSARRACGSIFAGSSRTPGR